MEGNFMTKKHAQRGNYTLSQNDVWISAQGGST